MDLNGEYTIPADREKVWDALNDPEILKQCIAGCETLDKVSDTEFTATVNSKVGPVRAKFNGKVTLSEIDAPNGYTISGEGQGGAAGFAKGGAIVKLSDSGDGTVLSYEANAEVGGKLASVGSRLIQGVAKKQADDFFGKFTEVVGGGAADETSVASPTTEAAAPTDATGGGVPTWVWAGGLVIVVAILLFAFAG